jgi:hypothetical protein
MQRLSAHQPAVVRSDIHLCPGITGAYATSPLRVAQSARRQQDGVRYACCLLRVSGPTGSAPMAHDCFLSYAAADVTTAEALYRRLTAEGFAVWFDTVRLQPGFDWHREIEAACEASRIVLPILTPRWSRSAWTTYETYGAEAIIPLIAEGRFEDVATLAAGRGPFKGRAAQLAGRRPLSFGSGVRVAAYAMTPTSSS